MPLPSPAPDTCIAYLIRHGATANNLADPPILQGRTLDGPLSDVGRLQAEAAAVALAAVSLSAVYSSPLQRAFQTAQVIAARHQLEVQTVDEITEVDVGDWESRSWVNIEREEPEWYQPFARDPATHGYKNGENLTQVRERVMPAITSTMQSHLGQRIAVIAHNVVNRVLLATVLDHPLAQARSLAQHNCGINILRYRRGKIQLISMNQVMHLESY